MTVVKPKDSTHEAPIRAAVEAAEAKALPRAIAGAGAKAAELARLSGLTLGPIVAISDAPTSPYGPFVGLGPDRFCGTVRTTVFRTDKATGRRKRAGTRSRHLCQISPTVVSTVTVTFAA